MFLFSRKWKPANIVVIRPGMTEFDAQCRIKGALDIPLSAEGTNQVKALAQQPLFNKLSMIYSAPTQAAQETARRIAEVHGIRIRIDDRLLNLDCGLWQGKQLCEIQQYQPCIYRQLQESPKSVQPPDGEPVAKAETRAREVVGRLRRNHVNGKIGVVVEEPMASIFSAMVLNLPLEDIGSHSTNYRCAQWEELGVA